MWSAKRKIPWKQLSFLENMDVAAMVENIAERK